MSGRSVAGVGAIVFDERGRVLLIRRAHAPAAGTWSLPGGHVEPEEPTALAAEREVLEETGLQVRAERHLETVRIEHEGFDYTIDEYLCALPPDAPAPRAGDDAADVRWAAQSELEALGVSPLTLRVIADAWAKKTPSTR